MLDLSTAAFRREPYVIGVARPVIEPALYDALVAAFPPLDDFKKFADRANKYSLSEANHKPQYKAFVAAHPLWSKFHAYIKSMAFVQNTINLLARHQVGEPLAGKFYSRWEFSAMPADGGFLRPHTDIASKVVTLVVPMLKPGEWDPAWGGGTDVLWPKPGTAPPQDYMAGLEAFDRVYTFEFEPNQAVIFRKTDDSWHSVGPIRGPAGVLRRTLTINIERVA